METWKSGEHFWGMFRGCSAIPLRSCTPNSYHCLLHALPSILHCMLPAFRCPRGRPMAARVTAGVGVGLGEREGLERVGQELGTSQSARRTAPKGLGTLKQSFSSFLPSARRSRHARPRQIYYL